jgi:RNA polymerase sigma-70 factor (ECF subfamily)
LGNLRGPILSSPPPERLNDLLDAVAEGDRAAFERVYTLCAPRLYGVTLRVLRDPTLAEEALVRACVRIWQAAPGFDPRVSDPDRWMVALARQAALEVARGRPQIAFNPAPEAEADEDEEEPAASEMSAELKKLLACMAELSGDFRRMLLLAYYDGWSREALALEFDAPAATIKTWLLRSLEHLRECGGR